MATCKHNCSTLIELGINDIGQSTCRCVGTYLNALGGQPMNLADWLANITNLVSLETLEIRCGLRSAGRSDGIGVVGHPIVASTSTAAAAACVSDGAQQRRQRAQTTILRQQVLHTAGVRQTGNGKRVTTLH